MRASINEPCRIAVFMSFADDALLRRVRSEYRESPGMRLTLEQAMRLWMLDRETCTKVLQLLIGSHFLELDRNGRYARVHAGY